MFDSVAEDTALTRLFSRPPMASDVASSSSDSTVVWPASVVGSRRGFSSSSGHMSVTLGGRALGWAEGPPGTDITGSATDMAARRAWSL